MFNMEGEVMRRDTRRHHNHMREIQDHQGQLHPGIRATPRPESVDDSNLYLHYHQKCDNQDRGRVQSLIEDPIDQDQAASTAHQFRR